MSVRINAGGVSVKGEAASHLRRAAAKRGIMPGELMANILEAVLQDDIVDAVLDDWDDQNGNGGPRMSFSARTIINEVAAESGLSVKELRGKGKTARVVHPRWKAIYRLKTELDYSTTLIAQTIGMGCHTSVVHALRRYAEMIDKPSEFNHGKVWASN